MARYRRKNARLQKRYQIKHHFASLASSLVDCSIIRQPIQQTDTQYHDEQPDGHYYEQGESEPTQYHGGGADP